MKTPEELLELLNATRICLGLLFVLVVFQLVMLNKLRWQLDRMEFNHRVKEARSLSEQHTDFLRGEWAPTTEREARDAIERLQKWLAERRKAS